MTWERWWKAVVDQIELFWGCEPARMDIPWREYFEAGLSPSDACWEARGDGLYAEVMGPSDARRRDRGEEE